MHFFVHFFVELRVSLHVIKLLSSHTACILIHIVVCRDKNPRQHLIISIDQNIPRECLMSDIKPFKKTMVGSVHSQESQSRTGLEDTHTTDVIPFDGRNGYQDSYSINLAEYPFNDSTVLLQSFPNERRADKFLLQYKSKRTSSDTPLPTFAFEASKNDRPWYSPGKSRRNIDFKSHKAPVYEIEYSVFRPVEYIAPIADEDDFQRHFAECLKAEGYALNDSGIPENKIDLADFNNMVSVITNDTQNDKELRPLKVSKGSSGSYFILGKAIIEGPSGQNETYKIFKRGIFKPKDEEPYGPLSPKWTKWLHRTFFPCFFGRSCLIPNLGYISEAAACVLDQQLLSYIVPYTDVIYLKSSQFYYPFWERTSSKLGRFKIGSFQMFLNDYVEAQEFFKLYPIPQNLDILPATATFFADVDDPLATKKIEFQWSKEIVAQFQEQLEKLVILDYIMRNTDRGHDNWMIKLEWRHGEIKENKIQVYPYLKIGAIDSGLAFPWKHPNEWRSFPFGWLFLPYSIIGQPFSLKTRKHYLPLLTSKYWWEQTITKLKAVFMKDEDFKERMWLKQVAVLKGQAFNVVEILKLHYAGPLELTRRENLLIWDDLMNVPTSSKISDDRNHFDLLNDLRRQATLSSSVASEFNETTPLLKPHNSGNTKQYNHKEALAHDSLHMSGFEFNLNFTDEERHGHHTEDETNTRRVVIERLEKVHSKPPVFTWC